MCNIFLACLPEKKLSAFPRTFSIHLSMLFFFLQDQVQAKEAQNSQWCTWVHSPGVMAEMPASLHLKISHWVTWSLSGCRNTLGKGGDTWKGLQTGQKAVLQGPECTQAKVLLAVREQRGIALSLVQQMSCRKAATKSPILGGRMELSLATGLRWTEWAGWETMQPKAWSSRCIRGFISLVWEDTKIKAPCSSIKRCTGTDGLFCRHLRKNTFMWCSEQGCLWGFRILLVWKNPIRTLPVKYRNIYYRCEHVSCLRKHIHKRTCSNSWCFFFLSAVQRMQSLFWSRAIYHNSNSSLFKK